MSSPELRASDLEAACQALVRVQTSNLGFEVQIPVIYSTGDFVTVVVTHNNDRLVVHDAGFAAMILANHGMKLSPRMRARITTLSKHYGCEFVDDRMSKVATQETLPLAVAVVANASRTIADQLLQTQNQPVFSFRQEVIERVKQYVGSKRVRENELVVGKSGTQYSIGAVILSPNQSAAIAYVEAVRDMDGVNKRFREFYDISLVPEIGDRHRIVLYDEEAALRQGDLILLQDVSNVVRFSDAEASMRQLQIADSH